MDLNGLRYFHEVVRTGSIRQAADRLHVAASAVSRQVAKLERSLDARLLERHAHGVRPTEAGLLLASRIGQTFRSLDEIRAEIDALRGLRRGSVTISSVEGAAGGIVPLAIAKFRTDYPLVEFEVKVDSAQQVIEALLNEEADIAVAFDVRPRKELDIVARKKRPICAVMAPTHPLAKRGTLRLRDICRYPVVAPNTSFGMRHVLERAITQSRTALHPIMQTNSLQFIKTIVRVGGLLAFLPIYVVGREVDLGELVAIRTSEPALNRAELHICVKRKRRLPAAAQAFLDVLVHTATARDAS